MWGIGELIPDKILNIGILIEIIVLVILFCIVIKKLQAK